MNTAVTGTNEAALRDVLDRWKAGVDAHDPDRVAAVFTQQALFQGLHPYSIGRSGVAEYYASQPLGMTADYEILESRRPAEDLLLGYLRVRFAFADRPTLTVYIGVVARKESGGWFLDHYQVSKLD